jgi:hypothetical protein
MFKRFNACFMPKLHAIALVVMPGLLDIFAIMDHEKHFLNQGNLEL